MKSHVLRPLFVVAALVALMFLVRPLIVPKDFGVWESGYMYGWHRKSNEQDWKNFKVKYMTREYCKGCHADKYETIMGSPHAIIQCENCHGPAIDHPADPPKLAINKKREFCLRCHAWLPYQQTNRARIPGIDPDGHNPGIECVSCHNPHSPHIGS
jgi:predicted CXXCH cytochrome family protein